LCVCWSLRIGRAGRSDCRSCGLYRSGRRIPSRPLGTQIRSGSNPFIPPRPLDQGSAGLPGVANLMFRKLMIAVVLVVGLGGAVYLTGVSKGGVKAAIRFVEKSTKAHEAPSEPDEVPVKIRSEGPWDGTVALTKDREQAVGLQFAVVKAQTDPIK